MTAAPPPPLSGSSHPFVFLASSYSTAAGNVPPPDLADQLPSATAAGVSNAEFRELCLVSYSS